ncbi:arylacetamide deacetylase-like isoform X5 [Rhinolophus sinicus]|uniref:arylacetamide deacetylase-like isoform X5 n=1 Tax=Rhinolophus sinicus TaxID=89399 RepID=UPI003D7A82AD
MWQMKRKDDQGRTKGPLRRITHILLRSLKDYDSLSRWTADRLEAVITSTNYRLAPKYHFPVQFKDVYTALKWFLHPKVLESCGVDPGRVGISGDSAGGNLGAAVTQQV